jgi:hypothetical protein
MSCRRFLCSTCIAITLAVSAVGCDVAPVAGKDGGAAGNGLGGGGTGGQTIVTCGSDNPDDLIADFTADNGIHPADGRSGGWYVYGDPDGHFDPPKNPDPMVAYPIDNSGGNPNCVSANPDAGSALGSFHLKGTGFKTWGAAAATDMVAKIMKANGTMVKATYDASKYKGISFWAKATAPLMFVQVKFPDIFSAAEADPTMLDPMYFSCTDGLCGFLNGCSPYIVKLSAPSDDTDHPKYLNVKIDTTWRKFDVLFADAKQDKYCSGYNPAGMLDLKHLVSFAIQVNANFTAIPTAPNDFELWIDDVRFIR